MRYNNTFGITNVTKQFATANQPCPRVTTIWATPHHCWASVRPRIDASRMHLNNQTQPKTWSAMTVLYCGSNMSYMYWNYQLMNATDSRTRLNDFKDTCRCSCSRKRHAMFLPVHWLHLRANKRCSKLALWVVIQPSWWCEPPSCTSSNQVIYPTPWHRTGDVLKLLPY
jgi:hypothetical protein